MKKLLIALLTAAALAGIAVLLLRTGPKPVSREKIGRLEDFIKQVVAEDLDRDYRSRGIPVGAEVTAVRIDRATERDTEQDRVYDVRGSVTYVLKGGKTWRDREGNEIRLGTDQEITHWFTCGVLEDKYLGTLYRDDRNNLMFYADKPGQ